jgi:nitrogen fixation/metabolism regulation signal transduction histidine kinase
MRNQRKRIWIDGLQTRLAVRLLFYAVVYQAAIWVIIWVLEKSWQYTAVISQEPQRTPFGVLAILTVLGLMGLMTFDMVRFVHRFVGPLYRFRQTVKTIAAGEPVRMVHLRKDDFLKDFMADFNEMLKVLEQKGLVVIQNRDAAPAEAGAR